MKKILIAPDSFKGCLTAREVAEIIGESIKRVLPQVKIIKIPIADGGEGTLSSISCAQKDFKSHKFCVVSPVYQKKVMAKILHNKKEKIALVEMAQASGLTLIREEERNPLFTTTYGTGELIKKALNLGAKEIIVFCGGSSTCDGGIGALSALGVKFYNYQKKEIKPEGKYLLDIFDFDVAQMDTRIKRTNIVVATDVSNMLVGKEGASYVFSPQKGASKEEVELLDRGLKNFAKVIRFKLKVDVEKIPGAGAAGGLPAGLVAFCQAKIKSGFEVISEIVKLEEKIEKVDLVITGEGKIDRQTQYGKVVSQVAKISRKYNLPVVAVVGSVGDNIDYTDIGISAVFSIINSPMDLQGAIRNSRNNLRWTTEQIINLLKYIPASKKVKIL